MTIRRRLFWSNILMIVIPVVISTLLSYAILFLFTRNSQVPMEQAFPIMVRSILQFQNDGDIDAFQSSVDTFNTEFAEDGVFIAVMEGSSIIYPHDADAFIEDNEPLLRAFIQEGATGSASINDMRFNVEQVGAHRIIVVNKYYRKQWDNFRPPMRHVGLIFLVVLASILVTNGFVTLLLTKRIMMPINQLARGANQLGEGNLDYRIHYPHNDEFSSVCGDFNEMADQLQKLIQYQLKNEQSRKELLAGISHDLRTPLTSIRAYVEGLLDGVAEDLPAQLKYLGIIRNKAEDIDHIVDKLFLFSKLDIGEYPVNPEKVDLGEELEAMAKAVEEEYAEKGLTMALKTHLRHVYIEMDPVYLHNIFLNILENSLRYKDKPHCTVTVRCTERARSVTVQMTDDGPGVGEDELDKLFEVFYRGDPSRQNPSKGSGLGLAISAKMMNRIGGSIRAENAEGGGLRITMEFPKYRKTTHKEETDE